MENFKIRVTPEQSRAVQETVFKNGLSWRSGGAKVMCLDSPSLFLTDGTLTHSYCDNRFIINTNPEITFEEFERKYVKMLPPHISELPYVEMEVRDIEHQDWLVRKVVALEDVGCYAISKNGDCLNHWNQYRPIKTKTTITKKQVAEKFGVDVETLTIEE